MRRWAVDGAVLVFFLVLTLWLTYPLVNHFTTVILGPPADNFEFLWKIYWYRQSFFDPALSLLHTDRLFYPFGYDLVQGSPSLAPSILALPLAMACGHVFAYNVVSILSLVLAGFGAYLLVSRLTGSRLAGIVSGASFGFSSIFITLLTAGDINILGIMWLPYLALCLEEMLNDHSPRWGVTAAVFCVLTMFSEWYLVPMVGIVLVGYAFLCFRSWRTHLNSQRFRGALLVFSGILIFAVALALVLTRPLWQGAVRTTPYSLPYVDYISPSLDYLFVPYALRTLIGMPPLSSDEYIISQGVYVGLLNLALAVLGIVVGRGKAGRGFVWMGLCALLLTLGPRLRWGGEPVLLPVPDAVERLFNAGMSLLATRLALAPMPSYYALHVPGRIYIPLPALILQLFVPLLNKMRYWARFVLVLEFALAVLAGMGIAYLESLMHRALSRLRFLTPRRREVAKWVPGVAVVLAIFFESAIMPYHMGYSEIRPRPVDLWLAQQDGDFAIAEFPYFMPEGPGPIPLRTLFHGKKTCSGAGTFPPAEHRAARSILEAFPSSETIALLKSWGPKYVLVGARSYGEQWEDIQRRINEQSDLRLVAVFEDVPIFHDVNIWDLVPGYNRELIVDRIYVYELTGERK